MKLMFSRLAGVDLGIFCGAGADFFDFWKGLRFLHRFWEPKVMEMSSFRHHFGSKWSRNGAKIEPGRPGCSQVGARSAKGEVQRLLGRLLGTAFSLAKQPLGSPRDVLTSILGAKMVSKSDVGDFVKF